MTTAGYLLGGRAIVGRCPLGLTLPLASQHGLPGLALKLRHFLCCELDPGAGVLAVHHVHPAAPQIFPATTAQPISTSSIHDAALFCHSHKRAVFLMDLHDALACQARTKESGG